MLFRSSVHGVVGGAVLLGRRLVREALVGGHAGEARTPQASLGLLALIRAEVLGAAGVRVRGVAPLALAGGADARVPLALLCVLGNEKCRGCWWSVYRIGIRDDVPLCV